MNSTRTIVIGDIHGCYNSLINLLLKVEYSSDSDTLVFVGDYIDRGPHSALVVSTIRKLQQQLGTVKVVCLRGNHEQMAIDYLYRGHNSWLFNGAHNTWLSYELSHREIEKDIRWFRTLPLTYQTDNFIICHAGLSYPKLEDNTHQELIWGRDWIEEDSRPREKTVIFGHTPKQPLRPYRTLSGDICIDCGCVYGGSLCAIVCLEDGSTNLVEVPKSIKDCEQEAEIE